MMGEVVDVDKASHLVFVTNQGREQVEVHYEFLILARGATNGYFGNQEFAP